MSMYKTIRKVIKNISNLFVRFGFACNQLYLRKARARYDCIPTEECCSELGYETIFLLCSRKDSLDNSGASFIPVLSKALVLKRFDHVDSGIF